VFNAVGGALSAIVLVITGITKFTEGAWIVVILVPALVALFLRIHIHYLAVRSAVALRPLPAKAREKVITPPAGFDLSRRDGDSGSGDMEREESPDQLRNLAVVPLVAMDLASLRSLAYAASLGQPVLAVHIATDEEEADRFRSYWQVWGDHVPLEVVVSPYRALVAPLARYLKLLHDESPDVTLTVVLPELIVRHAWQALLHNGVASRLRRALRQLPGVVVTTVPFHLPG
jgi:hypothetical protein